MTTDDLGGGAECAPLVQSERIGFDRRSGCFLIAQPEVTSNTGPRVRRRTAPAARGCAPAHGVHYRAFWDLSFRRMSAAVFAEPVELSVEPGAGAAVIGRPKISSATCAGDRERFQPSLQLTASPRFPDRFTGASRPRPAPLMAPRCELTAPMQSSWRPAARPAAANTAPAAA